MFLALTQNYNVVKPTLFLTLCLCGKALLYAVEKAPCCGTFKLLEHDINLSSVLSPLIHISMCWQLLALSVRP